MFEALLSNNRMKEQLTSAVSSDRPMHAYLFCGADGTGKKTAAYLLAQQLVGKNGQKVCRGTHPDVITVSPPDGKKLISVEQIRQMRADAFVKPSEGKRKIYIIDGVQLMNDAGQNALLTVLEQPPSFAVFILLSESRGRVLPTVVSRCCVYDMEYVEAKEGARYLKNIYPDISVMRLETAMYAASGNVGLAMTLAESVDFDAHAAKCEKLMLCCAVKNEYSAASVMSKMSKEELLEFLPVLTMYLRDTAVYRTVGRANIDTLVFRDSILKNSAQFDKIDLNILYDAALTCQDALELINANVNPALAAARIVILLCGGKNID